ncbi:MAG: hypothetical protein U0840_16865 [Gemmataceae bacterium]
MTPLRFSLTAGLLLALTAASTAQPPPVPVNPKAPTLNPVVPLGMQRGTALDLTLTGTNLAEPTGLWANFPAKVTIPTDMNNGKNPASLRVRLEVPADAPLGYFSLRVATKNGISKPRLFCIDDLPQVLETATNHEAKTAQVLPVPCTLVGRADAEVTDYFKVKVNANQRLSFEVLGRRLGSAFDPQITLLDAASGKELPGGFSNDAPGLQTDARLTHVFKQAGEVLIVVRDVSYRGGADFHYRLRIGDFPLATTPLPLAMKRGTKGPIRFTGPYVESAPPVEVQAPADPLVESVQVAPRGPNGLHGWPVLLHLSDLEEQLEREPNNDPKQAQRLAPPVAVTGRFETRDDLDHYVVTAKKGQRWIIEAHTLEHLSPTEVYMVLKNDKGGQVAATNPTGPARLDFTAPADGDYTLAVEHLHSWGGPDEVYRVTITPPQQEFSLALNQDSLEVAPGGTLSLPIFLTRNGYNGPIDVSVAGFKGITGTVTIPAGPAKPANQPSATLEIKAEDLPPGPVSLTIVGKATVEGKPVVRLASVRPLVVTAMGNLPLPPRAMFTQIGLAITEKPPYGVAFKFDAPMVQPGKPIPLTVTLTRTPGFTAEVVVTFQGLPAGAKVDPAMVKIPANQTTAKVTLTPPANAKVGNAQVLLLAAAKHNGRDWSIRSAPVELVIKK